MEYSIQFKIRRSARGFGPDRVLKTARSTRLSLEYADQLPTPPLILGFSTQLMVVNPAHSGQHNSRGSTQLMGVNSTYDSQLSSRGSTQLTMVNSDHEGQHNLRWSTQIVGVNSDHGGQLRSWNTAYDLSLRDTAYDPSLRPKQGSKHGWDKAQATSDLFTFFLNINSPWYML
ncbi:hypothetical protein F511_13394 [Dorcoceras hygrometricum]|uniref:Uncharacterized protein n=1 Tax=Dorcoceras hygrometricum TaxID=472368 RepID=A0A2Z7B8X2_9LAMI|nr:hypothetical protein F511_13394 [Dorcoceras hygrometricum]